MSWTPVGRVMLFLILAVLVLFAREAPASADQVVVETSIEPKRERIILTWPQPVTIRAEGDPRSFQVSFDRPIHADYSPLRRVTRLSGRVQGAGDNRMLVLPLKPGVSAAAFARDRLVVIDLTGPDAAADSAPEAPSPDPLAHASDPPEPPPTRVADADEGYVPPSQAPPEPAAKVRLRTGEHDGFTRLVFDWTVPVRAQVENGGTKATVTFDKVGDIDFTRVRRQRLAYASNISSRTEGNATVVTLTIPDGATLRDLLEGNKVVVDVIAPLPPVQAPPAKPAPAQTAEKSPPSPPEAPKQPAPQAPEARKAPATSVPSAKSTPEPEPPANLPPPNMVLPVAPMPNERMVEPAPAAAPQQMATGSFRFTWDHPVGAVIFARSGVLWVVFDTASKQDTGALQSAAGGVLKSIQQLPHPEATVLRMQPAAGVTVFPRRDGLAWIIDFNRPNGETTTAIVPHPERSDSGGGRIFLPVPQPGRPIAFSDPVVGDTLVVVPVVPLRHRVAKDYAFPQLKILATEQGIVIQPFIDTLAVRSLADGVELTSSEGLKFSERGEIDDLMTGFDFDDDASMLTSLPSVSHGAYQSFTALRQTSEATARIASEEDRRDAMYGLAEFFLAHHFAAEGLGTLQNLAHAFAEETEKPRFMILRGIANLLLGRTEAARADLATPMVANTDEGALWLVATATGTTDDPPVDPSRISRWGHIVLSYPQPLRREASRRVIEAIIHGGQATAAAQLLPLLKLDPMGPNHDGTDAYFEGRVREAEGDMDAARELWKSTAEGEDRRGRALATLALVDSGLADKSLTPEAAIDKLDGVRLAWMGDAVEFRVLERLGKIALETGDHRQGLHWLQQAIKRFPQFPETRAIASAMSADFEHLFVDGDADKLEPLRALAIYSAFKELTPSGTRGRKVVRRVAEELIALDLLDHASAALEAQMRAAPVEERAEIGMRLAEVRMMDGRAEGALAALAASASPAIAPDVKERRQHVEASALAALGRGHEALDLLAASEKSDTTQATALRAEIYRKKDDWSAASAAFARLATEAGVEPNAELTDDQAKRVVDEAVALSLSGNENGLEKLWKDYDKAMVDKPDSAGFRLLSDNAPKPKADPKDIDNAVRSAIDFGGALNAPNVPANAATGGS